MNRLALKGERAAGLFAERSMSDDAAFLREQARRCRRLARDISTPDVVKTLTLMAEDYEARAAKMEKKD
jgi:hypothetical protein